MSALADAYNISDLRERSRRRLPRGLFEFVDRGAEDDLSAHANVQAFRRVSLKPRMLVDVSARSLRTDLFGKSIAMPMAIAPTGAAGLLWHDGEMCLARAARDASIPFTLSTASLTSIERVASEVGGRLWFQLYIWPDRDMSYELVNRAQAAGYEALIVTVDTPLIPNREYNHINGFTLPFRINSRNAWDIVTSPRWLAGVVGRYMADGGLPQFENFPTELRRSMMGAAVGQRTLPLTDSLTWEHLRHLRGMWRGPLIVKGVLHADDAALAADAGADGVIVSNHGGRNLDTSMASLQALPAIVDRVGQRMTVMLDSGIRRGSDVVKALSLGAKAVLLGRAPLWGLASAGEVGVRHALEVLRSETDRVMGFMGCPHTASLNRSLLFTPQEWISKS